MPSELQKTDSSQALALKVRQAPAHYFFCRRIELPEDVSPDEREGVALLRLEEQSPFPLEHLLYGYVLDAAGKQAFLYAAYKRRFTTEELLAFRSCEAALPEFAVALLAGERGGKPVALIGSRGMAYFEFDDASELPSSCHGVARAPVEEGQAPDESAELEGLLSAVGERARQRTCRVWRTDGGVCEDQGKLLLSAREDGSDTRIEVRVDRDRLWPMDLRDPEAVEKAKNDASRSLIFWRAVQGMAALIALFFVGEIVFGFSYGYLKLRKHWNAEQAPLVALIESQQNTVTQLDDFQRADLAPFEMLIAIEPFRPKGVMFAQVETAGPNGLVVEARAQSASQVNEFGTRLKTFEKLLNVTMTDILPRADGTTFKARLEFLPGSFQADNREVVNNG